MNTDCRKFPNEVGKFPFNINVRSASDEEFESRADLALLVVYAQGVDNLISVSFITFIKSI